MSSNEWKNFARQLNDVAKGKFETPEEQEQIRRQEIITANEMMRNAENQLKKEAEKNK